MRRYALDLLVALLVGSTVFAVTDTIVFAADAPAITAGSGSGSGSAVPAPADQLHNPVDAPVAAYDDFKAAQKIGWPLALLAALVMLTRGIATAATRWSISWLAWLAKGAAATAISGAGAIGAAAFNTLALGGTWFAVAVAAMGALLALMTPKPAGGQ